jgi:hypothetical protein
LTDRRLTFGVVRITKGEHAGELGFYDDDDWDEVNEREAALVYLDGKGPPTLGDYVVIGYDSLIEATPEEQEDFIARNVNDVAWARAKRRDRERADSQDDE